MKELLTHREYFETSDNLSQAKYKSIFVLGNLILYVQILFYTIKQTLNDFMRFYGNIKFADVQHFTNASCSI